MDVSGDELAGVVDLFGGLTRDELKRALVEVAFRGGADCEPAAFDDDIDAAVAAYQLITYEPDDADEPLLSPGPAAFPELPPNASDLPHIMNIETRHIDDSSLAAAVEKRFRAEIDNAIDSEDEAWIQQLLDVSYELDAWGPVEITQARKRLDDALASSNVR